MNLSSAVHAPAAPRPLALVSAVLLLTASTLSAAPTPKPTPSPAATPTATPAATPTASAAPANYSGTQQSAYISTAAEAFLALRQAQQQPFIDANTALEAAGGVNAKGLISKEAITARRDLIAKCIAANEQYLNFVKTQTDTYRAELAKTPLIPGDVSTLVEDYAKKADTDNTIKLHQTEGDAFKAGDGMIAALEKSYGDWSVNDAGKLMFKKKSAVGAYSNLAQKYNTFAKAGEALRLQMTNANVAPPTSAPSATVPGASVSPTVSASPSASAKPASAATPTR